MKDQEKNLFRWIGGGGILTVLLAIPEMLIASWLSKKNPEIFDFYSVVMLISTLFIYLIISVIKIITFNKYSKDYKRKELEKVSKNLTSEFTEVLLNSLDSISKESIECQAKIDDDGTINYKIQLNYEGHLENYEDFLKHFHFPQD